MKRKDDMLERLAPLSGAPSRTYDDLLQVRAKRQLVRKIGAFAVVTALVVALVSVGLAVDDRSERPANPPQEPQVGTFSGMVITYTSDAFSAGDLVTKDPATGQVGTVLDSLSGESPIYNAAISGDGRWVAFDVATECGDAGPRLWVTNGVDEPRPLTDPCHRSSGTDALGLWEWSPSSAQLVVSLGTHGGALVLIDPATGVRTELGDPAGDVTSLAWSPDRTQIAYGTVPAGTGDWAANRVQASVYSVDVRSGDHALLANVMGQVPGGEEGSGLRWSPDSRRIAVLGGISDARLYLVKADGSGAELLTEGVNIEHILGAPNLDWSPDGTRITYATIPGDRDRLQIWNASPDGSTPVLVFDPTSSPGKATFSGDPVWSPEGTQIAFRYDPTGDEKGWLVVNADGTGAAQQIDELQYLSWRGGGYFCECYG